jgi:hypothetical protein
VRVVLGGRGPYIEFTAAQLRPERLQLPAAQRWRLTSDTAFYEEYRTILDHVMVYHQRRPVEYADYRVGHWYVSPFDLRTRHGHRLISGAPPPEKLP